METYYLVTKLQYIIYGFFLINCVKGDAQHGWRKLPLKAMGY